MDDDDVKLNTVSEDTESKALSMELNYHRIAQRQKQIDFGKNTVAYTRYRSAVPISQRRRGYLKTQNNEAYCHPVTPDKYLKCSKRCWDGLIRKWRRQLHSWDEPRTENTIDPIPFKLSDKEENIENEHSDTEDFDFDKDLINPHTWQ